MTVTLYLTLHGACKLSDLYFTAVQKLIVMEHMDMEYQSQCTPIRLGFRFSGQ